MSVEILELTEEELQKLIADGVKEVMDAQMLTIITGVSKPWETKVAQLFDVLEEIAKIISDVSTVEADLIRSQISRVALSPEA